MWTVDLCPILMLLILILTLFAIIITSTLQQNDSPQIVWRLQSYSLYVCRQPGVNREVARAPELVGAAREPPPLAAETTAIRCTSPGAVQSSSGEIYSRSAHSVLASILQASLCPLCLVRYASGGVNFIRIGTYFDFILNLLISNVLNV